MDTEDWKAYKAESKQRRAGNRDHALDDFGEASELARQNGMELRFCSVTQYNLTNGEWLICIYPGNQRLYSDKKRPGPWLKPRLPAVWGLMDVVKAATDASAGSVESRERRA